MTTTPRRRLLTPIVLAAVLLLSVGCSQDRHVFRSTAIQPKSVSLVSVQSGQTLWTKDIPVGQQLLLDFSRNGKGGEEYSSPNIPADTVQWELWTNDATARYGSHMKGGKRLDRQTFDFNETQYIMIDVDLLDPDLVTQ